ncbi:hypothetical protein COBT_004253, partial [Conglomerata obtusa]
MSQNEVLDAIRISRQRFVRTRNNNLALEMARNYNLSDGKFIRKIQFTNYYDPVAINELVKIRIGTFNFTKHLKRYYNINTNNSCLFCNTAIDEDLWHFLIECSGFNHIR